MGSVASDPSPLYSVNIDFGSRDELCPRRQQSGDMVPPDEPMPEFDLYSELGVVVDADRSAIERAWRSAVQAVHPDRVDSQHERAATSRTVRLNIAREWLTDSHRRARYDEFRRSYQAFVAPELDPMAPWPPRPMEHGERWWPLLSQVPVLVSLVVIALTLLVGVGSNVVTIVAFVLSAVTIAYYGLFWLVGVAYRRSRNL